MFKKTLLLMLLIFSTACLSIDRRGGVMGVQKQKVETGQGSFEVGDLPQGWSRPKVRLKQLLYENDALQATIVTDAMCGKKFASFEETSLRRLAFDLFDRLDHVKIISEKNTTLEGRQAYEMVGQGSVDGVRMSMEVVVLKKNFCLYDFIVFSPASSFVKSQKDFKNYVSGFRSH